MNLTYVNAVLFSSLLFAAVGASAQEAVAEPVGAKDTLEEVAEKKTNEVIRLYRSAGEHAHESRGEHAVTVLLNYSSFDLVLPSKSGATLAWHRDANTLYEIEYLGSSISTPYVISDLASMSEKRFTLQKRNFSSGGTFNWFWGFAYNVSNVHVSKELMVSLGHPGVSDLLDVQTLGMNIGLGNRWVIKDRFSIGVDWFSWSQPLFILKKQAPYLDQASNSSDRDKVDTMLNVLAYFPRWAALKVNVGYSF